MSKEWYSKKLGTPPPVPPAAPPPQDPGPRLPSWGQQAAPQPPTEDEYAPQQATHLRKSSNCPECGSTNYSSYQWGGKTNHRCYDCGFPVVQSGSGAPSMEGVRGVPVYKATQAPAAGGSGSDGTWHGGNFEITEHIR